MSESLRTRNLHVELFASPSLVMMWLFHIEAAS